ncbi:unknown [Clostridium sp. CAG:813]|nr:unknown [Clostridium sp. CAG:813]
MIVAVWLPVNVPFIFKVEFVSFINSELFSVVPYRVKVPLFVTVPALLVSLPEIATLPDVFNFAISAPRSSEIKLRLISLLVVKSSKFKVKPTFEPLTIAPIILSTLELSVPFTVTFELFFEANPFVTPEFLS